MRKFVALQVVSLVKKRATKPKFVAQSRPPLYFLQQLSSTRNTCFCCATSWSRKVKNAKHRPKTCNDKSRVFLSRISPPLLQFFTDSVARATIACIPYVSISRACKNDSSNPKKKWKQLQHLNRVKNLKSTVKPMMKFPQLTCRGGLR